MMMRLRQNKHGMLLLLLICCLLFSIPVHATETAQQNKGGTISVKVTKKNSDIKLSTTCGIDGFAVYDKPVMITVSVESKKDFTGSIRITPGMDEGQRIVVNAEEISLAGGAEKTFYFTVSSLGGMGKFDVQLLDEKEKVVYAETDRVTLGNIGSNVIMGILSDDYSALNYFDGIPVNFMNYQGMVSTLELNADSFPESSEALSVVNYIVIDNFDTAKLSDKQYQALKEWVKNGGVLILSLGPNYQNVLHVFTDDFVSGTLGTMSKKDLQWVILDETDILDTKEGKDDAQIMENMNEQLVSPVLKDVDCMDFELKDGEEIEGFSTQHSAYRKESGAGTVVVLSYALGMEPMAGFNERKSVAYLLVEAASGEKTEDILLNGNSLYYMGSSGTNIAKTINEARRPSALLFGIILSIYVILVGPVLYLVLKKKELREKIWAAVPLTALAFTGIVYLFGTAYRVGNPMVDTFTVLKIDDNTKKEKIYANITCPKAKQYSVMLNELYSDISYDQNYYDYSIFGSSNKKDSFDYMFCKKNGGLELTMNNATAFDTKDFTAGRISDNDVGNVDLDLHCYTSGFEGTITNNTIYDLEGVVVYFENYYYQAGDIKKGETVSIDRQKLITAYAYGTFENLYSSKSKLYTDRNLFMQYRIDVFMENNYSCNTSHGEGLVWGKIGSYIPELTKDSSVKTSGRAVYLSEFYGKYEDISGTYCPDINELLVENSGDYDYSNGRIYGGSVDMTYSFENYYDVTSLVNLTYNQKPSDDSSEQYAKVYAYNVETGSYEEIFTDSDTISGAQLEKYLVSNVLMLRFVAESTQYYESYMPKIAAKGEE